MIRGVNDAAPSLDDAVAACRRELERGEPLSAYNEAQAALARWPGNARLRQLQALALARSGDVVHLYAVKRPEDTTYNR